MALEIIVGGSPGRIQEEIENKLAQGVDISNIQVTHGGAGERGTDYSAQDFLSQASSLPTLAAGSEVIPTQSSQPFGGIDQSQLQLQDGEDPFEYNERISKLYSTQIPGALENMQQETALAIDKQRTITSGDLSPSTSTDFKTPEPSPLPSPSATAAGVLSDGSLRLTSQEKGVQEQLEGIRGLNEQLQGEAQFTAEERKRQGLPELDARERSLMAEINALGMEASTLEGQLKEQAVRQGLTTELLGRKHQALLHQLNTRVNIKAGELSAIRGDIETARQRVEDAVSEKFGGIKEQIKINKENLELLLLDPALSLADKNRALAQQAIEDAKEKAITNQETTEKDIRNLAMKALSEGASQSQVNAINSSRTLEDAMALVANFGLFVDDSGDVINTNAPMSINQIDAFRRNYGWTPPAGFTWNQLIKVMEDNPGATPEEFENQLRGITPETIQEQTTVSDAMSHIMGTLTNNEQDALFAKAKEGGFAKFWRGKEGDIQAYVESLQPLIEEAAQSGYTEEEIKQYILSG